MEPLRRIETDGSKRLDVLAQIASTSLAIMEALLEGTDEERHEAEIEGRKFLAAVRGE